MPSSAGTKTADLPFDVSLGSVVGDKYEVAAGVASHAALDVVHSILGDCSTGEHTAALSRALALYVQHKMVAAILEVEPHFLFWRHDGGNVDGFGARNADASGNQKGDQNRRKIRRIVAVPG